MSLGAFDIRLLHRLTECERGYSIERLSRRLAKSESTVRRSIEALNRVLPEQESIEVRAGRIERRPSYREFRAFMQTLSLKSYTPNQSERLVLVAIEAMLREPLNLAALYRDLGFSVATKKGDARRFRQWASQRNMSIRVMPRRGLALTGDELDMRLTAAQMLLPLVDLRPDGTMTSRVANTPIERRCASALLSQTENANAFWQACLDETMGRFGGTISYASKKFLMLYLMVSALRIRAHPVTEAPTAPVDLSAIALFNNVAEDRALSLTVSMLDFTPPLELPIDRTLAHATTTFFDAIQANIVTHIINCAACRQELYGYCYKQGLRKSRCVSFPDKMVRDAEIEMPTLYHLVQANAHFFEEALGVPFDDDQYTTLTLIFRKWINRSRVYGRNRKRVSIVTNTAQERIDFFIDSLCERVEVEIAGVYDINEIAHLKTDGHDFAITFSDRVDETVSRAGYRSIKLKFFLDAEDVKSLIKAGCSTSRRRYRADLFAAEIAEKSAREIEEFLRAHHGEGFA